MEEDFLIDLNVTVKNPSVDETDVIGRRPSDSEPPLMDFDTVLEAIPPKEKTEENCLLYSDPSEFLSPFTCRTNKRSGTVASNILTSSNNADCFSPLGSVNKQSASDQSPVPITEVSSSKLISPLRSSPRIVIHDVESDIPRDSTVPTGNLLQIQDSQISTSVSKDFNQGSCIAEISQNSSELVVPSISSIGSGESSTESMNKGFMEFSASLENKEEWIAVNDSVFEEAQALSEEFRRLALTASSSPSEVTEEDDMSIVDLDDNELDDVEMKVDPEEVRMRLRNFMKEINAEEQQKRTVERALSFDASLTLNQPVGVVQPNGSRTVSGSTISPLLLSTQRLDRIKLKASEAMGIPLKFSNLKGRASSHSALNAKSGPLKALIPLEDMLKRNSSSTPNNLTTRTSVASVKGTPNAKIIGSSPLTSGNKLHTGIISSTPKMSNLNNLSDKSSTVKKGLNVCNIKSTNSNVHQDAASTPLRPRTSSFGRVHPIGGVNSKTFLPARAKTIKGPSPLSVKKPGNISAGTKTNSIVRSQSTGNLPLTPSVKKPNNSSPSNVLQNSLKRTSSLSMKSLQNNAARPLMNTNCNSPTQDTLLNKMLSKFRRSVSSSGMKENLSPK